MTYVEYLNTMTVKTLTEIAKRMNLKVPSRAKKSEIVAFLDSEIVLAHAEAHHLNTPRAMLHTDSPLVSDTEECPMNHRQFTTWYNRHGGIESFDVNKALASDHSEALEMNETTFTLPGTDIVLTGKSAMVMRHHMASVKRFNPSVKRDKDGVVILSAKQRRRVQKNTHKYAKAIGFYGKVSV